jgi:hypothetical protein
MKTKISRLVSVLALSLGVASPAVAANLLVNGSFETGAFVNSGAGYSQLFAGSTAMTGWTVVGTQIVWGGPANVDAVVAPNGSYFLDLTSYGAQGAGNSGVTQTIATTIGQSYNLSLQLFNPIDAAAIGVNVVAGATATTLNGIGLRSFNFIATGTSTPITITQGAGVFFVGLDNVSVTTNAVGAPDAGSSVTLFLAGLLGLLAVRRSLRA